MQPSQDFSLVGLLMASSEVKGLKALQIVHNTAAAEPPKKDVDNQIAIRDEGEVGKDPEENGEATLVMISKDVYVEEVPRKAASRRPNTSERIRRLTDKLADEMHELMERHELRRNRQRRMQNTTSKKASTAKDRSPLASKRPANASFAAESRLNPAENHVLPNIYHYFQNARNRHLVEARQSKVVFPALARSETSSGKGLDSFSMRFNVNTIDYSKKTQN